MDLEKIFGLIEKILLWIWMYLRLVDDKKVHWRSNLELIWMPRAQFGLIWEDIACILGTPR